jgi:protein gp37
VIDMGKDTAISWAMHTHNEWIGCEEAGPECDHCYARTWNHRFKLATWGQGGRRHLTSESTRRKPLRWDRAAKEVGEIHVVFSASLSDWADTTVPREWVYGLFRTIRSTPNLFWMLLTKRPKVAHQWLTDDAWWIGCFGEDWQTAKPDVLSRIAVGTSVGTVKTAQARLPWLWRLQDVAGVFISMAPLLEKVDLTHIRHKDHTLDMLRGTWTDGAGVTHIAANENSPYTGKKPFVIVEGESGTEEAGVRPVSKLHPDLVRYVRDQCAETGTDFHFKQWGEYVVPEDDAPSCRICGCTWNNACQPDSTGFTCSWVTPQDQTPVSTSLGPLCSRCVGQPDRDMPYPVGTRPVRYVRVGTKASGRLLDGIEHVPAPAFLPANGRISAAPLPKPSKDQEMRHAS